MNAPLRHITTSERLRLTVEDFLLLDDSGAFAEHGKTELIEGEIWYTNAQHSRHARIKTRLAVELDIALQAQGSPLRPIVTVSTRVSDHSLPQPDIVVTSYKGPHVVPLDTVALLVEVSDTTLDIDLGRKLRIYAAAGIAEYWVVDCNGARIIRMWQPEDEHYVRRDEVNFGDEIASVTINGLAVATASLED